VQRSTSLMVEAAVRGALRGAQTAGAARAPTAAADDSSDGEDCTECGLADGLGSAASAVEDLSADLAASAAQGAGAPPAGAPRGGRPRTRRRGVREQEGSVLDQVGSLFTVLGLHCGRRCTVTALGVYVHALFVRGLGQCVGEGELVSEDARQTCRAAPAAARDLRSPSRACAAAACGSGERARAPQVLEALTSERGAGLVTLAIGVACRTSVEALAAAQAASEAAAAAAGRPDLPERLMRFAGAPREAAPCLCPLAQRPPSAPLSNRSCLSLTACAHSFVTARLFKRVWQPRARLRPV